jgi:exodeoxyribonuclease VII small subunit
MPADNPAQPTFEQDLEELESIVRKLESGDLPLEETLELFARGIALRDRCQQQLNDAESRIEAVVRRDNTEDEEVVPFEPETEA